VAGSSIAMVATGPIPGRTPISVPRTQPIRQYNKLIGVTATPKKQDRVGGHAHENEKARRDKRRAIR